MDTNRLLQSLDHTLLRPTSTWKDIQAHCDEALEYRPASVCIPPCYVRDAAAYLEGRVPVCTVIGFPLGNCTTGAKLFSAKAAIQDGASEIDMVINLGHLKDERYDKVFSEISGIKVMVGEENILKVIIETCLLTEEEMVHLCIVASQAGADYIKTSTGFSTGGATPEAVRLLAQHAANTGMKVKASGGIRTLQQADQFLELGAARIGSGSLIALLREQGITGEAANPTV